MASSTRHGPDPGPALIRISPTRIHTQVTQTVRYRPVRSLLFLGLLVIVSLFVLFTLSQMAVVQHTMMAQLETGRAGGAGLGVGTMVGGGGGRVNKQPQRPWRSQFNQFKIEPLLIRNAPSVEVNTALAANRRRASQLAAIIVRNSLLVSHSAHYKHSNHRLAAHSAGTHGSSHATPHPTQPHHLVTAHNPHTTHKTTHTVRHTNVTHSSSTTTLLPQHPRPSDPARSAPPSALKVATSSAGGARSPGLVREGGVETSMLKAGRQDPSVPKTKVSGEKDVHNAVTERQIRDNGGVNTASGSGDRGSGVISKTTDKADNVRRRFLSKVRCDTSDSDCDNHFQVSHNSFVESKVLNTAGHTSQNKSPNSHGVASKEKTNSYFKTQSSDSINYKRSNTSQRTLEREKARLKTNKPSPDLAGTESGEPEKDFEPLYLREDDSYDQIDDSFTTIASPVTEKVKTTSKTRRKVSRFTEEQLRNLPVCPEIPPGLLGRLDINLERLEKLQLDDVLRDLEWVAPGGRWSPVQDQDAPCLPRHKVAVVLPYRDRLHHLIILLSWLHPILRRQQLEYTIYVAEQAGNATFNKGAIMNAGFMEAWQRSDANCFVFHDVDLLPEDDRNMYSCPPQPRHLSVGVDTLGYKLPYFLLVGGVLSVRGDHFLRLNGYSNMYWGWGGEDDDMGYRIKQSGLTITRPPSTLARYTMIRHLKRRPLTWKVRGKLVRTSGRRYRLDGLNTLKYSLLSIHRHPLFTHLLLDVGTPPENVVRLDAH